MLITVKIKNKKSLKIQTLFTIRENSVHFLSIESKAFQTWLRDSLLITHQSTSPYKKYNLILILCNNYITNIVNILWCNIGDIDIIYYTP